MFIFVWVSSWSFRTNDYSEIPVAYKYRALDKTEHLVIIFSSFFSKLYVVTPHLNCLVETVQMRDHNICFYAELTKIISNYQQILPSYVELWLINMPYFR